MRAVDLRYAKIVDAAEAAGACKEALRWARQERRTINDLTPEWAYWLRLNVRDLPPKTARAAELKASEDPKWAYHLRCDVPDLPPEVARAAERKASESPEWAYYLRHIPGLTVQTNT